MRTSRIPFSVVLVLLGLALFFGCENTEVPTAPETTPTSASKSSLVSSPSCVTPPTGMVSWWPGDGNAEDIQGDNDGALQAGVTFVAGQVDQGFSFDGTGAVEIADDPSLKPSLLTIDTWVKGTGTATHYALVGKSGPAANVGYELFISEGLARFLVLTGTTDDALIGNVHGTTNILDGSWHHIAGTYDGTAARIYVDGILEGSDSFSGSIVYTADPLYIGRRQCLCSAQVFDGVLDEVEIFNRALSGEEIQAIFNAGSAGKCKTKIVELDIKPGSEPNSINPKSNGVIPVAILTTADFDATTVDPLSVAFGPDGAEESHSKGHIEDVDGDGDDDLLLHFKTKETGIASGDTEACLTGSTFGGDAIEGCDAIQTVGK